MNKRKQMNGPRPQSAPPQSSAQSTRAQYWWPHRRYYPYYDYDWYDHDWYDYDWYDHDYDYDGRYYATNKVNRPPPKGPVSPDAYSEDSAAYQQGFKDGWQAAMDYMMNQPIPMAAQPMPTPMPTPPLPPEGVAE